jgi:hypothetical protein
MNRRIVVAVNGTIHELFVLVRDDAEVNTRSNTFEHAETLARLALDYL